MSLVSTGRTLSKLLLLISLLLLALVGIAAKLITAMSLLVLGLLLAWGSLCSFSASQNLPRFCLILQEKPTTSAAFLSHFQNSLLDASCKMKYRYMFFHQLLVCKMNTLIHSCMRQYTHTHTYACTQCHYLLKNISIMLFYFYSSSS